MERSTADTKKEVLSSHFVESSRPSVTTVPSPAIPTNRMKRGKQQKTKRGLAVRPIKRHWACSSNQSVKHNRIRGHQDCFTEILTGKLKSVGTARFCSDEAPKCTDLLPLHRVEHTPVHAVQVEHHKRVHRITPDLEQYT